jgi:hypothetical protein
MSIVFLFGELGIGPLLQSRVSSFSPDSRTEEAAVEGRRG